QLHEMMWYLHDASTFCSTQDMFQEIEKIYIETEKLTHLPSEQLEKIDLFMHRMKVNAILKEVHSEVQKRIAKLNLSNTAKARLKPCHDYVNKNLTQTNLIGANFAGVLLIEANLKGADLTGANFIGTDMRNTNIRGANLRDAMFLTQTQVNAARGDKHTLLPRWLERPGNWE
ncbi:MAG: pentapeptide repeat-containing protein, partial [Bacilli bacterium]